LFWLNEENNGGGGWWLVFGLASIEGCWKEWTDGGRNEQGCGFDLFEVSYVWERLWWCV